MANNKIRAFVIDKNEWASFKLLATTEIVEAMSDCDKNDLTPPQIMYRNQSIGYFSDEFGEPHIRITSLDQKFLGKQHSVRIVRDGELFVANIRY